MSYNNKIILAVAAGLAALVIVIFLAQPKSVPVESTAPSVNATTDGSFTSTELEYDFGNISMAQGKVSRVFTLKNEGNAPVTIQKLYTSCMCTTATLLKEGAKKGPFGMPGHGFIPSLNEQIGANESATIEVTFDPAAHGPAGVGKIERIVSVENSSGKAEITIRAFVTP